MTVKKYSLTPKHKAQLPAWTARWNANAMSTTPMTDEDRRIMRVAIKGMYEAANLTPPPDERIVFVPSPLALRFAGGFAAAIWHLRDKGVDVSDILEKNPPQAKIDPTMAERWWVGTTDIHLMIKPRYREFLLECAKSSHNMWNGGNQWSGWVNYLSFFRHVARLGESHGIDYSKWDHYEKAAIHGGPRIMHEKFAMVSDRPVELHVDSANRPHCDTGPFTRWSDGSAYYAIHGVYVPAYVVEHPECITVDKIHAERNGEIRRIMTDRYGLSRYVRDAKFDVVDADIDPLGQTWRLLRNGQIMVIELVNSTVDADGTRRVYHKSVHPELRPLLPNGQLGAPQKLTALNAVASTYGMRGEEYVLEVET